MNIENHHSEIEQFIKRVMMKPLEEKMDALRNELKQLVLSKEAYTLREVAELTSSAKSTIYECAKAGKLKTFELGGKKLVLKEDLLYFLKSQTNQK